jgi:hypothetical protein
MGEPAAKLLMIKLNGGSTHVSAFYEAEVYSRPENSSYLSLADSIIRTIAFRPESR